MLAYFDRLSINLNLYDSEIFRSFSWTLSRSLKSRVNFDAMLDPTRELTLYSMARVFASYWRRCYS